MKTENNSNANSEKKCRKKHNIRWMLVIYDTVITLLSSTLLLINDNEITVRNTAIYCVLVYLLTYIFRFAYGVYEQVWRYGGSSAFIKLIIADTSAFAVFWAISEFAPIAELTFTHSLCLFSIDMLGAVAIRLIYCYANEYTRRDDKRGRFLSLLLRVFSGSDIRHDTDAENKIRIAIVGAGRVGTALANELMSNSSAAYTPCFFIDIDSRKIGRQILELNVFSEEQVIERYLEEYRIQEVVFALPRVEADRKRELYEIYKSHGVKVKVYDYPVMEDEDGSRRRMREFNIEELLFRKPIKVNNEETAKFYTGKTVLITGGGGSIGSELCRQIAKMNPARLVILDVYENGAYDVQQELRLLYAANIDISIEIVSVCNRIGLERVFAVHKPDVVIMAAAHKHVPLMEHNCVEAVENNVFGTLNTVELSEKYGVQRVIMVSTDKAVNPTNVMGATKRVCEMIVLSHAATNAKNGNPTTFSATRFGNVLGSAGSVVPLFRRQISHGGPITITDKRIVRYFMTIPEASQLVLQSGAMAKNGELFVLDMGQQVKIYDLAVNMIRLCGLEPDIDIPIIETGLRPGEKLYEELLVKTEELDKTDNSLIFIERDNPISREELDKKLGILRDAVASNSDANVREALRRVVPTFRRPEEVNNAGAVSK